MQPMTGRQCSNRIWSRTRPQSRINRVGMVVAWAVLAAPLAAQVNRQANQPIAVPRRGIDVNRQPRPADVDRRSGTMTGPGNAATNGLADASAGKVEQVRVAEVQGLVEYGAMNADPLDPTAWQPVQEGMLLSVNTQIRTGLRSRCVLLFGTEPDLTVVSVRRATLASIIDFRKTQDTQRIRIGLGYGAVRGGSSEGTLRSDVVVDSTVATLAKRGTEGWQIEIEPMSGYFRVSLSRFGLVDALARKAGVMRTLEPGEYVSSETIARMWVTQDIFDRTVTFFEERSLTSAELNFVLRESSGLGYLSPNGNDVGSIVRERPGQDTGVPGPMRPIVPPFDLIVLDRLPIDRPEGDFGVGATYRLLRPHSIRPGAAGRGRVGAVRTQRRGLIGR